MKRVVLCEGRRDVRLVETFYDELADDVSLDTFYGEDVAYERLRAQESDAIRNFRERRNPYDVLAKSENGKPDLKRVFTKLIRVLARWDIAVTLLVDLDGGSLDDLLADLDTRVRDNYSGQEFGVEFSERVNASSEQTAAVAEFRSRRDGQSIDTFDVVAFHHDLETSADIDGSEQGTEEREKLVDLVTDERATAPMRSVFL